MRTPHHDPLGSAIIGAGPAGASTPGRSKRSGPARVEPERRCVLSGAHGARDDLVRLALSPPNADGTCEVLPDALARAPGRGAWLGVDRAALDAAVASGRLKGALARSFRGAALTIPADLGARTEAALARALADRLGLELRAGHLVLGSDRIADLARAGRVTWLGHAADAGEDGSRRLDQALRVGRDAEGSGLTGATLPLDRATLSVAMGRDNVVHLALTDSAAARRVTAPLARLMRFLGRLDGGDARPVADDQRHAARPAWRDDELE